MEVAFHKNFQKRLKKLPPKVQAQFYKRLELFMHDRFNKILNNHSVENTFANGRSMNVTGDCRAIFRDQGNVVIFITIGTHAELY